MEKVFAHITELHNQTNQVFEFEVENGYNFHIRALPPGKKGYVKLWKVLKAKHECPTWKMRFMMNKEFTGVEINAIQLLYYARIIIKLERIGEGLYLPYLEAILEKRYADYWLRLKYLGCNRDKYWDRRPHFRIRPDLKWAKNLRVMEVRSSPQLVFPVANQSSLERFMEARSSQQLVFPVAHQSLLERVMEARASSQLVSPVANQSLLESCRSIENLPTKEESNERKINASPPAEEHGLPKIRRRPDVGGSVENIERGLGGNYMQKEDGAQRSSIRCEDMKNTVHLMLLAIAFICVLHFKFLV